MKVGTGKSVSVELDITRLMVSAELVIPTATTTEEIAFVTTDFTEMLISVRSVTILAENALDLSQINVLHVLM